MSQPNTASGSSLAEGWASCQFLVPQSGPSTSPFWYTGEAEPPGVWQYGDGGRNFPSNPLPHSLLFKQCKEGAVSKMSFNLYKLTTASAPALKARCIYRGAQSQRDRKALVHTSRHLQQGEPRSRWTDCTARFRPVAAGQFPASQQGEESRSRRRLHGASPSRGFGIGRASQALFTTQKCTRCTMTVGTVSKAFA